MYYSTGTRCGIHQDITVCNNVEIVHIENNYHVGRRKAKHNTYRIAGKVYQSKLEIAQEYDICTEQAYRWIKKGVTPNGDIIRRYIEVR